jgi:hypothetical protein
MVLQGLDVWMSEHDISAGDRWGQELSEQLEKSNFGVVCLTPENLTSSWLIFEAGALSKAIRNSRVVPYRFDLKAVDVGPPMAQFQGVDADENGTRKLVMSIHESIESALPVTQLEETLTLFWPRLAERLASISRQVPSRVRSEREMLEELLELMRRAGSRELQETLSRMLSLPSVHSIRIAQKQRSGQPTGEILLIIRTHKGALAAGSDDAAVIPTSVYGMTTQVIEIEK